MSKPTKFEDLPVAELRRIAIEDFAVPVEEGDNKKSVVAALAESGVTWDMYVAQHPEVAPDEVKEEVVEVVVETPVVAAEPVAPVVAAPVTASGDQPWLIKMTRENVRYDTRGYTFTKEHPYALVKPEDVEFILEKESGFRQAYPSELQEFYAK